MSAKIAILDRFNYKAIPSSTKNVYINWSENPISKNNIEGLIVRSGTQVDKDLASQFPNLKAVVTSTSGFDHIDFKTLNNLGVSSFYTPDANAQSAAEHSFALLLASSKDLENANQSVRSGVWQKKLILPQTLEGKKLGIIGLGRIGKRVAKFAQSFSMKVIAYDPYLAKADFSKNNITSQNLESIFSNSDFISLHLPKTKESIKLITEPLLDFCKKNTVIINTSRGEILRNRLISHFLSSSPKRRVAVDVLEDEPLIKNNNLLKNNQITFSPHIGAYTQEAFFNGSAQSIEIMELFFEGSAPKNCLPPDTKWARQI